MKKIISIILTILLSVSLATNVYAIELSKVGETVTDEGEYNSVRFNAGNTIKNKSTINGIALLAGNDIKFEGTAEYGLFAGNSINVSGKIQKDLFVAGNNIIISETAEIGRDLFIAGNMVNVNANLNRDLRIGGSTVNISNITINGDVYVYADRVTMNENTIINGKLTYKDTTKMVGLATAKVESVEVIHVPAEVVNYNFWDEVKDFIISYCAGVIVLIALLFVIPKAKERLNNTSLEVTKIFKTALLGCAVLVVVPVIAIIALLTYVLIPMSLIVLAIYIICIYLSQLVASYVLGNVISTKVLKKESHYIAILIGVLILKLVKYIPGINTIVIAFAFLYGMGLIYRFIASREGK